MKDIEKRYLLEYEIAHMEAQDQFKLTIDQVLYTSELLSRRKCSETVNFEECEKDNRKFFERIFKMLSFYLPKDKFIEQIKGTTNSTLYALLFVQDVYAISNNFHSVGTQELFEEVFNYIEAVVKETKTFVDLIPVEADEKVIIDIVKYLAASAVNLVDFMSFGEALGFVKKTEAGYIESDKPERIKELILSTLESLWSTSEKYFDYERFHYKVEKRDLEGSRRLRNLVEDWEHIIYFEGLNIRTTYREKLFTDAKAEIAVIYCFVKYPYLSNGFSESSQHFVGMRMYDKEYKELTVDSISSDNRPTVIFEPAVEGDFGVCKIFTKNDKLTTTGVETKQLKEASKRTFYNCNLSVLGEVGLSKGKPEKKSGFPWLIVCLSVGGAIILAVIIYIIIRISKKKKSSIPSLEVDSPLMGVNNNE